jgi:hypothetical protein
MVRRHGLDGEAVAARRAEEANYQAQGMRKLIIAAIRQIHEG